MANDSSTMSKAVRIPEKPDRDRRRSTTCSGVDSGSPEQQGGPDTQLEPRSRVSSQHRIRRLLFEFVAAAAIFVGLEALLFRTDLYPSMLKPDSYSGRSYFTLQFLDEHRPEPDNAAVLVVGDSRIGEGFSAKIADQLTRERNLEFFRAANAGTNLRVWFYLLREIDPQADRFTAVVIPMTSYGDLGQNQAVMAELNINSVIPLLRYSDVLSFARRGIEKGEMRSRAATVTLLKGIGYRQDFQDFVNAPGERLRHIERYREHRYAAEYQYQGRQQSLAGLAYDSRQDRILYPPDLDLRPAARLTLERVVRGRNFSHDNREFHQMWLGRIVKHYHRSDTRLVFVRLPRGPLRIAPPGPPDPESVLRSLASNDQVSLLAEGAFDSLEYPEFYFDGLHLNREGRLRFSRILAEQIADLLTE